MRSFEIEVIFVKTLFKIRIVFWPRSDVLNISVRFIKSTFALDQ